MAESKITDLSANNNQLSVTSIQGYPSSMIANASFQTTTAISGFPYPVDTAAGTVYPNQTLTGTIPIQDGIAHFPYIQMPTPLVIYKFNEGAILDKIKDYIDSTYTAHYSEKDGIQALEFIMSNSDSYDFLKGNVLKYTARYGKKEGHNPKDILKAIHYLILLYHFSLEKK
jgi:hypothetical protein